MNESQSLTIPKLIAEKQAMTNLIKSETWKIIKSYIYQHFSCSVLYSDVISMHKTTDLGLIKHQKLCGHKKISALRVS